MVTYILIPAHNEAATLGRVIDDLRACGWKQILVVNDASSDKTPYIARGKGVYVIDFTIQQGQGAALQAGFDYLKIHAKPDIIVTFDADGQHDPADIASLIRPIVDQRADITLGSRFLREDNQNTPFIRMLVLKCAVLFTRIMTRLPVTDTHNGLRALNIKAYSSVRLLHSGMAHASEFFDSINAHNLRWEEVPVSIGYTPYTRKKGQKIYHAFPIAWRYIVGKIRIHEK